MTDPITTIELDAVEQSTCQHKACNDQATRIFAVNGNGADGPAIAGYCRYHQLNFARQSDDHLYLGEPKRPSDFSEVSFADER